MAITNTTYTYNWLTVKSAGASSSSTTTSGTITHGVPVTLTFSYAPHYGVADRHKTVTLSNFDADSDLTNNGPWTVTQAGADTFTTVTSITPSGYATGTAPTVSGTGTAYAIQYAYNHAPDSLSSASYITFRVKTNTTSNGSWHYSATGDADTLGRSLSYTTYNYDLTTASSGTVNGGDSLTHALPQTGFYDKIYGYIDYKIQVIGNSTATARTGNVIINGVTYTITVNGVSNADISISGIPSAKIPSTSGTFSATLSSNYDTSYTITIS